MPEPEQHLAMIDKALAQIDDELASRYPGVALSRASLLQRRRQVIESQSIIHVTEAAAAAPESVPSRFSWRGSPQFAFALGVTAGILFSVGAATSSPHTAVWTEAGVATAQAPLDSSVTGYGHLTFELAG